MDLSLADFMVGLVAVMGCITIIVIGMYENERRAKNQYRWQRDELRKQIQIMCGIRDEDGEEN